MLTTACSIMALVVVLAGFAGMAAAPFCQNWLDKQGDGDDTK